MKKTIGAFLITGIWISVSEFIRNEVLFKQYWIDKYESLNLTFPSEPLNNALWGVWSFIVAGLTVFLTKKLNFKDSVIILWISVFLLMWVVIGNLNVLPFGILLFAIPLSVLEILIAVIICRAIARKKPEKEGS